MEAPMANFIGLYYPYIHFKDEGWLKTMALYWDGVKRIVPTDLEKECASRDSETVRELVHSGLIENVPPQPKDEGPVRDPFLAFLTGKAAQLRTRYRVENRNRWAEDPVTAKWTPTGGDKRLAYVYVDKMWPSLRNALVETGLAEVGGPLEDKWIGMHPRLADVYMTALAEQMTSGSAWSPITDETLDQLAVSGFSIERLSRALLEDASLASEEPGPQEARAALANYCFETVIPQGVASVPVKKIIELRQAHRGELNAFQRSLDGFRRETDDLGGIDNPAALTEHLRVHYDKTIAPSIKEVRKAFRLMNLGTATSIVNVNFAVPAGIAGAAAWAGLAVNPVLAGIAGFALGAVPVVQKKRDEAQAALKKPGAWLVRVEEGLQPTSFLSWVQEGARKFAIGV